MFDLNSFHVSKAKKLTDKLELTLDTFYQAMYINAQLFLLYILLEKNDGAESYLTWVIVMFSQFFYLKKLFLVSFADTDFLSWFFFLDLLLTSFLESHDPFIINLELRTFEWNNNLQAFGYNIPWLKGI